MCTEQIMPCYFLPPQVYRAYTRTVIRAGLNTMTTAITSPAPDTDTQTTRKSVQLEMLLCMSGKVKPIW